MKKILVFATNLLICAGLANAAVRDGTNPSRTKSDRAPTQSRVATTNKRATNKTSILAPRSANSANKRAATSARSVSSRVTVPQKKSVISRAGTEAATTMSDTRTGAEYEKCKNTYFSCMDQFCTLKNDDYRRCSCSDRVFDMIDQRATLEDANEQLTVFTESLEAVGMTAAQATAMKQASEGENALTSDKSASKALLQAIMNSISGKDTNVGGKYSDLNSINISFDTANAFGMSDAGQAIAAYNGVALYSAVYPQCRQAVKSDCTDASLQRAVTAYLMAVEQDCNTVQTAIDTTKKQLKSAVREGSAMLDLARVENRQNHNSSNLTACINEIESAILSEQVCGANYHKCLDNGEYIDVSTGKPIAGVVDFANLGKLLKFADGVDAAKQKLSKLSANRTFIQNFESRVKKFAADALDKCTEQADIAWADYLDKALLDIYYAQQSKVNEIKQACFDFVSSCYINADKSISAAMKTLTAGNDVVINPDKIALTDQLCADYIESCDGMFGGDGTNGIVAQYVASQKQTDMLTSCRAVAKQCFDKYGGSNYENFYYPYSGLFQSGRAPDWFALQEYTITETIENQKRVYSYEPHDSGKKYISTCANQLSEIAACQDEKMIEQVFGGLNKYLIKKADGSEYITYGTHEINTSDLPDVRHTRPTGVATEVYNRILSVLSNQCMNIQGRFVEYQNVTTEALYNGTTCRFASKLPDYVATFTDYNIFTNEYICPRDYDSGVDTLSWGICSCWANGARRSKNGNTTKCVEEYRNSDNEWTNLNIAISSKNQVCVNYASMSSDGTLNIKCITSCDIEDGCHNVDESIYNDPKQILEILNLPEGI